MIGFIRSFFQSKLGVILSLAFIGVIALLFASGDVVGSRMGNGVSLGGDHAAKVGKQTITTGALSQAVSNAFDRQREQQPTLSMKEFLANGAVGQVLDDLIDRAAIFEFGRRHGIAASDRLVDSEIVKIPAFRGPTGAFDEKVYRQALAQNGLTDQTVRGDIMQGLVARQVLVPAAFGAVATESLAQRFAALAKERRSGVVTLVPSQDFAPAGDPDQATLTRYFAAHSSAYSRPERRTIRYATFSDAALKSVPAPTETEIAKAYADNRAQYAPSESRTITQVILPTQAAAQAVQAEVARGTALDAAARAKGLLANKLTVTREELSGQTSREVADAVFGAASGKLAGPARSPIGWHLARIDSVTSKPGKSLDQARPELVAKLAAVKRRAALSDMSAKLEEQLDGGANLGEVAKDMGLTVTTLPPVTADGRIFGKSESVPAEVARVVQTAFSMEREGQPQLAEVVPGQTFVIFDVAQITPAAPPPLAEIRNQVVADWKRSEGWAKAKAAADRALASIAKGMPYEQALNALKVPLKGEVFNVTREQLIAQGGRIPAPLALMFSMAKGTTKRLEAPGKAGWFIVTLRDIVPGAVAPNDPRIAGIQNELGRLTAREYAESFRRALRKEVGVEKDTSALKSVASRLTGGN
ncbi:SurA N-terminal domain-containing protein [Novosphingobium tardum]|uniref:SurA N-terminal domain-containing protein n=1 Tax=Novosphingobium tardum TaxID=1538021 RepID=A0ABV8RRV2_9SPHN